MKFCGIDLPSDNRVIVVRDEEDKIVVSRRGKNCLSRVLSVLEPYKAKLAGVVSSNWYWLVDGLILTGPFGGLHHRLGR